MLAGRIVASLAVFPLIFISPAVHYFGTVGMAGSFYVLMLVAVVFGRRLSRRMEERADKFAREDQTSEGVYAKALEKLYRENQAPAVMPGNRRAHPHLFDRMVSTGVQPDFPRPAKARRITWIGWVYIVAAITLFVMAQVRTGPFIDI